MLHISQKLSERLNQSAFTSTLSLWYTLYNRIDLISLRFARAPQILIEALTGDFQGDASAISLVAQSGLDVYAHNMETVESRTPFVRDPRAKYRQSLEVLRVAKEAKPGLITKTSIMLGVGEEDHEILQTLKGKFEERISRSKFSFFERY